MTHQEILDFVSKYGSGTSYLLTLKCGDTMIAAWDKNNEHFYHYLNRDERRQEAIRYDNECRTFNVGCPNSASEAASMYIGTPKQRRRYVIVDNFTIKSVDVYIKR